MMTVDEAVQHLRSNPRYAALVRDAYIGADLAEAAERFANSAEFAEVLRLVGGHVATRVILDLGAGTGIASYAFANAGAKLVYALEPDASKEVGRGAILNLCGARCVHPIDAMGERIPLQDSCVDLVYARQVLHHIRDLSHALCECARVLQPGGTFIACREHVIKDRQELTIFLEGHPMHQLTGTENAYRLEEYIGAIEGAGLTIEKVIGPWDSVINAFPGVRSTEELQDQYPRFCIESKVGKTGAWLLRLFPGFRAWCWKRITRPVPGWMYSFVARKQ